MLNAYQLNIFLLTAEIMNFTQAVTLVEMSQQSVSQHTQTLE